MEGAWGGCVRGGSPPPQRKFCILGGRKSQFPNKTQGYYTDFPSSHKRNLTLLACLSLQHLLRARPHAENSIS